jgi:hypothetical protein
MTAWPPVFGSRMGSCSASTGCVDVWSKVWNAVTYGNGKFVAVDSTGYFATSTDGNDWTLISFAESRAWAAVAWGGGKFVTLSSGLPIGGGGNTYGAALSPDGATWTAVPITGDTCSGWSAVVYGNDKFVAVANSGTNRAMFSTDGTTWTAQGALAGVAANSWTSVAWSGTNFCAGTPFNTTLTLF